MTTYKVNVYDSGSEYWHLAGTNDYHREGAPAVISAYGRKAWYQHGKLHNEYGAAVLENNDRVSEFWLNGKQYKSLASFHSELENRRRAEARLKRELEQDALTFAMMHPPVFVNTDKWHIQPKNEYVGRACMTNSGLSALREMVSYAFTPLHAIELTVAEIEEKLGHRVKIIKEK